jgi:general stress protein CsbA
MFSRHREAKNSRLWVALAALVVLLPALYVLGSGPAAWLVIYDRISMDAYQTVYAPLVNAESQFETVWYVSRWYRELFIPKYCWGGDDFAVQCGSGP